MRHIYPPLPTIYHFNYPQEPEAPQGLRTTSGRDEEEGKENRDNERREGMEIQTAKCSDQIVHLTNLPT